MPKKLKIFSLKIYKGAGIKKKSESFLNKGTKHKENYMEGLNSKNKNVKGSGSPQDTFPLQYYKFYIIFRYICNLIIS